MNPSPLADPKRCARIAGGLYLLIIVAAGFAQGYVRSTIVVPGDAHATAQNILGAEALFRAGFAADLVAFLADAAVAVLLYVIFRPVNRTIALLAAAFRLLAHPAIAAVNLLHHLGALFLLQSDFVAGAFDSAQVEGLALLSMELHRYGYLIAGAFFGVHCALLGYLAYRSRLLPRILGILLMAAAGGYLLESFTFFLAPASGHLASYAVVTTAGIAEVSLCLYLLFRGVRRGAGNPPSSEGPAFAGGRGVC